MPSLEKATLLDCCNAFNTTLENFSTFVETGTWMGDTARMASDLFQTVYTIEVLDSAYQRAKEIFNNTNVTPLFGDSVDVLPTLLPTLSENVIFWLDGHNSGPNTGVGKFDFPVLQECTHIDSFLKPLKAIILIDDVRLFGIGHDCQIDNSLLEITVEKILQTFKNKKVINYQLFDSHITAKDRLGIFIE